MRRAIKVLMKRAEGLADWAARVPGVPMKLTSRLSSCLRSSLLAKFGMFALLAAVAAGAAHAQAAWVQIGRAHV